MRSDRECVHAPDSSASRSGGPEPERAFVVLRHAHPEGDHYDLMFDDGGALATWRSPCPLSGIGAAPVTLKRIGDHRLAYLDYEGPVSGDRGSVERVERGTYVRQAGGAADEWRVTVRGERTVGEFRWWAGGGEGWSAIRVSAGQIERAP